MTEWLNRIVGEGEENPDQLLANPENWRVHPKLQQDVLSDVLDEVGWVQRVIVNRTTGHMVDGHLRAQLAISRGEPSIPVTYVELTVEEERKILATLDPLAAMAATDEEKLAELLGGIAAEGEALRTWMEEQAGGLGTPAAAPADVGPTLADRFVVPPLSVLDSRQGYWRARRAQWLALGIRSEEGRGENLLHMSLATRVQTYYQQKADAEERLGHELTPAEFEADYLEIPPGATATSGGTSMFDPVLCEIAYRWFSPEGGRVLDPFAGGSVRGIVAGRLGRRYEGIELQKAQVKANRDQLAEIGADPAPKWIVGDAREQIAKRSGSVDLLFSCPPYANLERYSDDPRDLSTMPWPEFLEAYRAIIAAACERLAADRFAVWVIGEVRSRDADGRYCGLVPETIRAFEDAGLGFYNESILVTTPGSVQVRVGRQFAVARKLGKTHQNVLVFVKGNARAATEACGQIEVDLSLLLAEAEQAADG